MRLQGVVCSSLIALAVMTACAPVRQQNDTDDTPPPLVLRNHPLAGEIYTVKTGRIVGATELLQAIASAEFILIGETHDNSRQHQLQARMLDHLAATHASADIAFEMIDPEQGHMLAMHKPASADELISLLNHVQSGWDYDHYYRDLFRIALLAGFNILPANIETQRLMAMMDAPGEKLPADINNMVSRHPLLPAMETAMAQDIADSHCGVLSPEQVLPMLRGQRLRDATMAMSLQKSAARYKILIAGNGHVRNDWGVPRYLETRQGGLISIGLLEVETGRNRPADYMQDWHDQALPFDYVWFTPRAGREDPCIAFIKSHKIKK